MPPSNYSKEEASPSLIYGREPYRIFYEKGLLPKTLNREEYIALQESGKSIFGDDKYEGGTLFILEDYYACKVKCLASDPRVHLATPISKIKVANGYIYPSVRMIGPRCTPKKSFLNDKGELVFSKLVEFFHQGAIESLQNDLIYIHVDETGNFFKLLYPNKYSTQRRLISASETGVSLGYFMMLTTLSARLLNHLWQADNSSWWLGSLQRVLKSSVATIGSAFFAYHTHSSLFRPVRHQAVKHSNFFATFSLGPGVEAFYECISNVFPCRMKEEAILELAEKDPELAVIAARYAYMSGGDGEILLHLGREFNRAGNYRAAVMALREIYDNHSAYYYDTKMELFFTLGNLLDSVNELDPQEQEYFSDLKNQTEQYLKEYQPQDDHEKYGVSLAELQVARSCGAFLLRNIR